MRMFTPVRSVSCARRRRRASPERVVRFVLAKHVRNRQSRASRVNLARKNVASLQSAARTCSAGRGMEALNRIKKGVADTIQKADDEIRDRARREAERQVIGSRGASSNGARSESTGARRPDGGVVAHGAQARSSRNDAANVDVELAGTTMRSELDETRRRLDDFDARLERRLTEERRDAPGRIARRAGAGSSSVDALVREEVRRVLRESQASNTNTADVPSVSPVHQKRDQKLETFEAATRAAETAAPGRSSISADAAEGLDNKVAAAVASEVPSWIAESLRALEARLAAAEKGTAAAAMVSTARLGRESDETDAVEREARVREDALSRSTPRDSLNVPKRGNEPSSKRCAPVWKRLRRWRFPPRRRRRAEVRNRRRRELRRARTERSGGSRNGPFSPKKSEALRGEAGNSRRSPEAPPTPSTSRAAGGGGELQARDGEAGRAERDGG